MVFGLKMQINVTMEVKLRYCVLFPHWRHNYFFTFTEFVKLFSYFSALILLFHPSVFLTGRIPHLNRKSNP